MNFANSGRFDHNSRRGGQNARYSQLGKGRQCSKGTIGSIAPDRNPIVRTYRAPTKPERIKRSQSRARECNPWPGQNQERARGPTSKWRTKRQPATQSGPKRNAGHRPKRKHAKHQPHATETRAREVSAARARSRNRVQNTDRSPKHVIIARPQRKTCSTLRALSRSLPQRIEPTKHS